MDFKEFFEELIEKNKDSFDKKIFIITILFYFIVSLFAPENIFFQYLAMIGMNIATFTVKNKFEINKDKIVYYTFFPPLLSIFIEQVAINYIPLPEKLRTIVRFVINAVFITLI
jgi:hypothetical protein